MIDRLIRIATALAAVAVAVVTAILSYQHAYQLVRSRGESGMTARLLPFTVDGLIWAASMVVLDASRRTPAGIKAGGAEPGAGIVATVGAKIGARHRSWASWRPGQRMARIGADRLIRAADDADSLPGAVPGATRLSLGPGTRLRR